MTKLLIDACGLCGRFVPHDKLMVFDKLTGTAFHYCCYVEKQNRDADKYVRDSYNDLLMERTEGEPNNAH